MTTQRYRFRQTFGVDRPIIGMVHLPALPGTARWSGSRRAVLDRALADAGALAAGGVDAIMVENFGDVPFMPGTVGPATVAAMTRAVAEVVRQTTLPVGVNMLRNDAPAALAVAAASGARFIRVNVHTGVMVTDQGIIEGTAHETLVYRRLLDSDALILADVLVKHASPLAPLDPALAAEDAVERGLADALVVTGVSTGRNASLEELPQVRGAVPHVPVLIGSGVTPETVQEALALADGVIVGTAIKQDGVTTNPVDLARVRALVAEARRA